MAARVDDTKAAVVEGELPHQAQAQTVTPGETEGASVVAAQGSSEEDIYIGFPKGDTAPRAGRQGRFVKGDPSQYPDKADVGVFRGATGGWAGGEAALWDLRDSIEEELSSEEEPELEEYPEPSPKEGATPIYIGFGKDPEDFKRRNAGVKGQIVYDTEQRYPSKEDVGFLEGVTGGFAGGERGVKAFVAKGDVKIRRPGEVGGQPFSPVATGFLIIAAGATAGALVSAVSPGTLSALTGASAANLTLNLVIGGVVFAALAAATAAARDPPQ